MINGCWITVNRACNMKCEWCYAQNSGYNKITLAMVNAILKFLKEIGVKSIMLIGGEPTVSDDLMPIIHECKKEGFYITLITNGLKISNDNYIKELASQGLDNVSLSQKAFDRKSYIETTGVDGYSNVLKAITNLKKHNINFSVSHVLTLKDTKMLTKALEDEKKYGAEKFAFSFCYDFDACQLSNKKPDNPYKLWKEFKKVYPLINDITNGKISLQMGLPICVTDDITLTHMIERNQIRSVCQLLKRNGLIFDTEGYLIPCNAMFKYRLGKFGVDFFDKNTYDLFVKREEYIKFYEKLLALPDKTCSTCDKLVNCAGGCIANWFNYDFSQLRQMERG